MKRILLLLCGIILVPTLVCSQRLVEVGKGYSCTSVNTTVFRNNSLVTHGEEQYISYYEYLENGNWIRNNGLYTVPNIREM